MMKKSLLLTIIISSIVVVSVTSLGIYFGVFYEKEQLPHPDGTWAIRISGKLISTNFNISINELIAMPYHKENYVIKGSTTETIEYKGVSLSYLLNNIINYNESAVQVNFVAFDEYIIPYSIEDLLANERIILAYERDGEYLEGPDVGGSGYLRLIVPQSSPEDYNGPFCLKNLVELEIV
ncbi:MAG: molybdopterin-dependent oxidoreductase [Candidatus Thorarchaeota archaeon]